MTLPGLERGVPCPIGKRRSGAGKDAHDRWTINRELENLRTSGAALRRQAGGRSHERLEDANLSCADNDVNTRLAVTGRGAAFGYGEPRILRFTSAARASIHLTRGLVGLAWK